MPPASPRPFRAAALLPALTALASACAATPPTPATGPPGSPATLAGAAASSAPPTVVHQGIGHPPGSFQATPRKTWMVDAIYGELVIVDPETATIVWRFPMPGHHPQIIMSPDARYVAALVREPERARHLNHTWLYAWDLAAGRELFHRQVAIRDTRPGGLLLTAGTIHIVECDKSSLRALNCGFRAFDLATGAPRQPPLATEGERALYATDDGWDWHPPTELVSTQYSADGRLVLVPNGFAGTIVYRVDPPAVVAALPGPCAELDAGGDLLWVPKHASLVPAAQAALQAAGVRLRVIPTCPAGTKWGQRARGGRFQTDVVYPVEKHPIDYARWPTGREQSLRIIRRDTGASVALPGFNQTSSINLFPKIGVNHDLMWQRSILEKPTRAFLQRAARAELPRRLPGVQGTPRFAPDGTITWGADDIGRLRAMRSEDFAERPPVLLRAPGVGKWFLDPFVPFLPDGRFLIGTESGRLAVALGPTPTITRLPWVGITDDSTNVTFAGQRYLLVGDTHQGLLVVDLQSHRRVGVIGKYDKTTCSDALPTSDGKSAWVIIGQSGDEQADRIEQLSVPDGRVLASRRLPKLFWAIHGNAATFQTRTGWLEPDRRLWIKGSDPEHACLQGEHDLCVLTVVDLTTDPAGVRTVNAPGVGMITAAPDNTFFAQTTSAQFGFNLFRPDGQTFLTTGAFGDGSYSFTPDGRFACTGGGCQLLRCTVGGRSEPIDHPACGPLRRAGFSIDEELARRGR